MLLMCLKIVIVIYCNVKFWWAWVILSFVVLVELLCKRLRNCINVYNTVHNRLLCRFCVYYSTVLRRYCVLCCNTLNSRRLCRFDCFLMFLLQTLLTILVTKRLHSRRYILIFNLAALDLLATGFVQPMNIYGNKLRNIFHCLK